MPPRRRVIRNQAASASREGADEHVPPPAPPIDEDALRQMVQDAARQAAQEEVQQAAHEAARVAPQEVVRQMIAAQQVRVRVHRFRVVRRFRCSRVRRLMCSRPLRFRLKGISKFQVLFRFHHLRHSYVKSRFLRLMRHSLG